MKRTCLAIFAVTIPAASAMAQGATNEIPATSPLKAVALADALAEMGRVDRDPLKLIVAASLRKSVGLTALGRAPEGSAAEVDGNTVEALLDEAIVAAKGAASVKALADDVRARATKGRAESKGYSVATVAGAKTDWYRGQKFLGGKYAEIAVTALAGGGFDLFVYDDKGNLVCRDLRQPRESYCGWSPSETAVFDIKIENRTGAALKYRLVTN